MHLDGVNKANRQIFLIGDIDEQTAGNVIKGIYFLEALDHKAPIQLFVNSFGGSDYDMFGLYDVLTTVSTPIHTIAVGKCMSAAPLVVAAGTRGMRCSMPNTQWMVHMASAELEKTRYDELETYVVHWNQMADTWCSLMARHTQLTGKQWRVKIAQVSDTCFGPKQALKYGLVDFVRSPLLT